MARTWSNYPCRFSTINTLNTYGNSSYVVTAATVLRLAPINRDRAPGQIDNRPLARAMAYMNPGGKLFKMVMAEKNDANITIHAVKGDQIWVRVRSGDNEYYGIARRLPIADYATFDFTNTNGVLSHVHIGHCVDGTTLVAT